MPGPLLKLGTPNKEAAPKLKTLKPVYPLLVLCLVLLMGCSRDNAKGRFEGAETSLGNGEFERAIEEYRSIANAVGTTAYGPISLYKIASIYDRHLDDKPKAVEAYYTLYSIYPESAEAVEAREAMAIIYSEAGNHAKAIDEYQWVLEKSPAKEKHYRYLIAMEYLRMNDFRQTRLELRDLLDSLNMPDPPPPGGPHYELIIKIYYQTANSYYLESRNTEATKAYDELISKYPGHPLSLEARLNKAHILIEDELFEPALEILNTLAGVYPHTETIDSMIKLTKKRIREGPSPRRKKQWRR
jgi:tetratricopeptide (TPR) repeat protein